MEGTVVEKPTPDPTNPWNLVTVTPAVAAAGSSPWGKSPTVTPCSLQDVMSEQLAVELQEKDDGLIETNRQHEEDGAALAALLASGIDCQETKNDILLAQMLQHEFDKEHDKQLQKEENKFNGTSKVSISFQNYRSAHPALGHDVEEDEEEEEEERTTEWEKPPPVFNRSGISGKGKNITTKHDPVICGRRNATRMMEFSPEFEVGDAEGMDMKLPNHVYNKLKAHSQSENKRSHRLHEKKEHSTAEQAMDPRTRLILYKLVNSGTLDSVSGSIASGKESMVCHAYGGSTEDGSIPTECAIKVFKTTLTDFKTREKYVHGDHRFARDDYKKFNPRKIIKIWAEKETANLKSMRKYNIPCPSVVALKKHVLVMSFIGQDQQAAPKLKDVKLPTEHWQDAYEQTVTAMKKLQKECQLVHADLSEFNILWHDGKVWLIDVSQAVELQHPQAMEFLYRDCGNVTKFFKKQGVHDVPTPEALFNEITGLELEGDGQTFLIQIRRFDKEKTKSEAYRSEEFRKKEYAFDFFFEQSMKERETALSEMKPSDSDADDSEEEEAEED